MNPLRLRKGNIAPSLIPLQGLRLDVDEQRRCRGEGGGRWGGINRFICLRPTLIILPLPFVPDLMKPKCQVRRGPHIESCQSRPSVHLKLWCWIIGFNTRAAGAAWHADDSTEPSVFCFFFSKEELHLAADAQVIATERILRLDGRRAGCVRVFAREVHSALSRERRIKREEPCLTWVWWRAGGEDSEPGHLV